MNRSVNEHAVWLGALSEFDVRTAGQTETVPCKCSHLGNTVPVSRFHLSRRQVPVE